MIGVVNGVLTLLLIILFLGICVWAWSNRNKEKFDKMANLPLEDDSASVKANREVRDAE